MTSRLKRAGACVSIFLVLSLTGPNAHPAPEESPEQPDSLQAGTAQDTVSTTGSSALVPGQPFAKPSPIQLKDQEPPVALDGAKAPVYKEWWFWSAVGVAVLTAVVVSAAGGEEAGRTELPDFPDPPDK